MTNATKKQKCYKKSFEYKGQMINYYNKVRKNPDVDFCVAGFFMETGYTVMWTYAQKKA